MDIEVPWSTKDIDLAAFLATEGLKPDRLQPPPRYSGDRFVTFVYEPSETLREAVERWQGNEPLRLDLRDFLEARMDLYREMKEVRG